MLTGRQKSKKEPDRNKLDGFEIKNELAESYYVLEVKRTLGSMDNCFRNVEN